MCPAVSRLKLNAVINFGGGDDGLVLKTVPYGSLLLFILFGDQSLDTVLLSNSYFLHIYNLSNSCLLFAVFATYFNVHK